MKRRQDQSRDGSFRVFSGGQYGWGNTIRLTKGIYDLLTPGEEYPVFLATELDTNRPFSKPRKSICFERLTTKQEQKRKGRKRGLGDFIACSGIDSLSKKVTEGIYDAEYEVRGGGEVDVFLTLRGGRDDDYDLNL